ncbi:MAG: alkaline phosphatase [Ignavibacteria bacterium]
MSKPIISLLLLLVICGLTNKDSQNQFKTGNVIFIHPDGTSLATYNAARTLYYGPDGEMNWDKLTHIGLYQGHTLNTLTASSQAGATIHAYGVKVVVDSYGMNGDKPLKSLSGSDLSIMMEAKLKGYSIGIVNSGTIVEPGTGVFVASDVSRGNRDAIAKKIIESKADIILSGGEQVLIPEGVTGKFGPGKRKDGLNLIEIAKGNGYHVIFSREELRNIPDNVVKVLGVFESHHTFNDQTEESLRKKGLQNYSPDAPTVAEMTEAAIHFLSKKNGNFFLVVEEEGTDNMGNKNNANGMLEAVKRADDAIGVVLKFLEKDRNTLLITAADSEAGGMEMHGWLGKNYDPYEPLNETCKNGAPQDGRNGTGTRPFMSAKDKYGHQFPFAISWSCYGDVSGSVVAKAEGLNAELMKGKIDNTDIYRIMYATLFGKWLE